MLAQLSDRFNMGYAFCEPLAEVPMSGRLMALVALAGWAQVLSACGGAKGLRLSPAEQPTAEYAGKSAASLVRLFGRSGKLEPFATLRAVLLDSAYLAALRAERAAAESWGEQDLEQAEAEDLLYLLKDGKLTIRVELELRGLPGEVGHDSPWADGESWRFALKGLPRGTLAPESVRRPEISLSAISGGPEAEITSGGRLVLDAVFRVGIGALAHGAALTLEIRPPAGLGFDETRCELRWKIAPAG